MKMKLVVLVFLLSIFVMSGCENMNQPGGNLSPGPTTNPEGNQGEDVVSSASIVSTEGEFEKSISSSGTWIIAALKDMSFTKDLVLEGEFKNSNMEVQRKIALYAQDDNRVITNRYTLTAPKLTIKSPNTTMQGGIFTGDLYVETADFKLVDMKIEGNVYFNSTEAKNGFSMDGDSSVTGKQEVK